MANDNPHLSHGAFVLVADGATARLLRNDGTPFAPRLHQVQEFSNPERGSTRELGADRPGRAFQSTGARRSGIEQTDLHEQAEQRFAVHVMELLDTMRQQGTIKELAIVAAPRTLAVLRETMTQQMRAIVLAEIDKDLTKHPAHEIDKILAAK